MTYFQTFVSHPGAQGAGRPTGSGYLPITSPGYITNPSGQQYMQIQPSTFFQPQNLQGTYAEVAPQPSTRIEINPTALAYQSYTSPSPPAHNNQQYNGGGDPRYQGGFQTEGNQIYQDRPKQYQIQSLFHQYQNGPEVMSVSSPQTCPQHPMTPPTLKSPIQTFSVSAPSLGESTELTTKPDTTNGLTLSYPDDQSMFVKDSGQGIAVSSSSAEDVFKAKASLYGIEICTRAEGLASGGKQRQVLYDDLTSSMNDMEVKGEKVPEMLFQMTHIEPEESNESDDSATTSTEASIKCTNVSQQSISDSDTVSTMSKTEPEKSSDENVYEQNYYGKNIGKISNQYLMTSEDINGCVVYSESVEHELKEKNKDEVISITANSWSKGSCTSSLDHIGEYFITVQDENASSASDEEIGIFRNYVLEAVMPSQKNKKTGAQKKLSDHPTFESELCKTIMTSVGSEELKQEQKSNGTFDVLVEEFVKTIIIKACEVVAEQNGLSGGYHPAHVKEELADVEVNNNSCCEDKTDSEKLDLVEGNLQNFKDQDEADDKQISHHIDVGDDSKEEPVDKISEPSLVLSSSWDMAWNQNIKSKDENSNHCSDNVMNGKRFHCDSESTEQSSDYSDSLSQLNPISPEFKPRRYLKNKTFMRPDAPAFQPFNVQDVKWTTKEESCQTEGKEYKDVASNTHRIQQVDSITETASCDTLEVCINTMDSCFSNDNDYFVTERGTYSEQGTQTESQDKKSFGGLVKPHDLDACTVDKKIMTKPVTDYLESLIATQRELLHLRGAVCAQELKRQIQELERSKHMFQNMRGEPLDKVIEDRVTSLKIEINIIQNQVMSYDAHLAAGNVFKSVPQFTVSIPVGGQNIIAVNKHVVQKSCAQNVGTKRSFWDAYTLEEDKSLHDLGRKRPAKINTKVNSYQQKSTAAFQTNLPHSFNFTSTQGSGSDAPISNAEEDIVIEEKLKENRKQRQTTSVLKATTEITDVTDLMPKSVMNMNDIDDAVSPPRLSKTTLLKKHDLLDHGSDQNSNSVKNQINVSIDNYTNRKKSYRDCSNVALQSSVSDSLDSGCWMVLSDKPDVTSDLKSAHALSTSVFETQKFPKDSSGAITNTKNSSFTSSSSVLTLNTGTKSSSITTVLNGPSLVSEKQKSSITTVLNGPSLVSEKQKSNITTVLNGPSLVSEKQKSSITTVLNGPSLVSEKQKSSITTVLNGPSLVSEKQKSSITTVLNGTSSVSSILGPLPVSHLPASFINTSHCGSTISTQTLINRQNVSSVQLASLMTGPPIMATPRIIPGQQSLVLYPQAHPLNPKGNPYLQVRPPQPNMPSYSQVHQVQPSMLPYLQVIPGQATVPFSPVISNTKTPLLPRPQMTKMPTSAYQGNPLFHSNMIRQTSPALGSVSSATGYITTSVSSRTVSTVPPVQISNSLGQKLDPVTSTKVQGQRRGSSLVPANTMSSTVTSTGQTIGTLDQTSVDPGLHQAVIVQLRQAYPHLAADPLLLEAVAVQQTQVLQNYIDASKTVASDKDSDNTSQQKPTCDKSNYSSSDCLKSTESSRLPISSHLPNIDNCQTEITLRPPSSINEQCVINSSSVTVSRQPPGLANLTDTDQTLSEKFQSFPDISMEDLSGQTKKFLKTVSDLTKMNGSESKDISQSEQKHTRNSRTVVRKASVENKITQKQKSLLDNFQHVDQPVVHELKASPVFPDSFEKQEYSSSKNMDSVHSNLAHNVSKNMTPRHKLTSESSQSSRETFRRTTPNSVGEENWEDEVDPDPKPFYHDFRKVRPAEKTKASLMSEISKTNLPPGLPSKKPTDQSDTNNDGASGMSAIPLTSKTSKTSCDLDHISDGEGEDWHQVSKKKKEKKKTEAERPRRKSGSDVSSSKSNNFEKLVTKMSEVFTTLSRERIIELITEVRKETKGLSGMNMKQIITKSRQVFIARRHHYQTNPKQKNLSPTPTSQKALKKTPITGKTAVPGPGKTLNFKPLSASVIQTSKDFPLMDDEEEICVICHDALDLEETKTLECGHVFHAGCIKQWVFGQERTCPNCRRLALFPEEFPRLGK